MDVIIDSGDPQLANPTPPITVRATMNAMRREIRLYLRGEVSIRYTPYFAYQAYLAGIVFVPHPTFHTCTVWSALEEAM